MKFNFWLWEFSGLSSGKIITETQLIYVTYIILNRVTRVLGKIAIYALNGMKRGHKLSKWHFLV